MKNSVLCVGEILWDIFPTGKFIGGAPLNVACHLHMLGWPVRIASRIGHDALGEQALRRMREIGMDDTLVQVDPSVPTGTVDVELINEHTPRYKIKLPAAWDFIELVPELMSAVDQAQAIVFGSLCQRTAKSRGTIHRLVDNENALHVFDINLRQPFLAREHIDRSLELSDLLKLNDQELDVLRNWYGLPSDSRKAAETLASRFDLSGVCITYGAKGAVLWQGGQWYACGGYPVVSVDPVGAGDAFLAGLLEGILTGKPVTETLEFACAMGAFVTSQQSATPRLDQDALRRIRSSHVPSVNAQTDHW